ncbi:MAG: hypothetical protein GY868_20530, partial [Deltaproteobacteria bacterium]|nr:hypothetical protein [Deltaproteobacteria bacterium]
LEFHSFDQSRAEALRQQVQTIDRQNELERFLLDVLDAWGVDTAEAALSRSWVAHPGLHMRLDSFPGIPDEGLTFTFDRTQGLEREDIVFMSWEHPLALGAIDVVTGDQDARICAVQWKNGPAPGVFVHFVFLLEAEIPATWGLEGVAPAVPLDVFVDAAGSDCSSLLPLLADAQVKALPRPGLLKKQIAWCENEGETIARGLCADRATAERATWERAYRKYRAREMLQTKLRERMGLAADNEDSFAADVSQRLASAQLRLDAVAVLVSDNRSVLNGEE